MDGWITIGTKLDSKQLDNDLKAEETRLKKYGKENEMLIKAKIKIDKSKAMQEYKQLKDAIEKNYEVKMQGLDLDKTINSEVYESLALKYENNRSTALKNLNEAYSEQLSKIKEINQKLISNKQEEELTKSKIQEINEQLGKTQNFDKIKTYLNDTSNKTESIIRKVAKWGLAIFSVRSAYMFIRQSVSTLSQYNEKIGADIEYIRYALASSLQPIIENIIQLMYKMLAYINYISQAWFGVNIFANASAKAFGNVKKNLGGANKQAKELQKTLLGFDEMNILQDGSTAKGGGGGGITLPSFDLGNIEDVPIPSWIKWIADNGPFVVTILGAIGAALVAMKLTTFIGGLMGVTEGLAQFSAGAGVLVAGLVLLAGSIARLIINWDDLTLSQKQASVELASFGGALVALGLAITGIISGPMAGLIAGISLLAGVVANVIIEQQEEQKTTMSVVEADKKLKQAKDDLVNATSKYTSAVKNAESTSKDLLNIEKRNKITGQELYESVVDGTLNYKDMTTAQREVFDAYIKNMEAQEKLNNVTKEYTKSMIAEKDAREQKSASVYAETQQYEGYFKKLVDGYNNGKISAKDMVEGTLAVMSKMDESTRTIFAQNLPQNVKDAFKQVREEIYGGRNVIREFENGVSISYKDVENANKNLISDFGKTFATKIPNDIQKSIDKVKNLTSSLGSLAKSGAVSISATVKSATGSKNAKGAVYYPPKLATGGIINMPGRGVPLGAIGGERGAEGVIPLTDSQMMEQLGEAIGRNVVINAILNNYMNSRLISREQQKTSNVDKFAFNG